MTPSATKAVVTLDPHGRVVPSGDEARRALADRAGSFELLPSAPDLLIARRRPAAGGAPPPERCLLAGDLAGLSLADFVGFIHQSRLSGLLTVSTGSADRAVLFAGGEVRAARSGAPGERIGEIALRLGLLEEAQLAATVEVAAQGDDLFGKVLVDRGLLTSAQLWKCLHEQVATVFHGLLLTREGVFTLVEAPAEPGGTPLSVNTQGLLMDGIRRIDELGLFRTRIPGPRAFVRRKQPKVPATLKPVELALLSLVDGKRRVADLAQAAHLSEFDATKILYHLSEGGWVTASEEPAAAAGPASAEQLAALAAGMNDLLRLITVEVAAVRGALEPFLAGVRGYLADPAGRFAALWPRATPGRDGAVDAPALLAQLTALDATALARIEPGGDRGAVLFEALRELMLFYLFQAGERLPRDADERLGREVKARFERLRPSGTAT